MQLNKNTQVTSNSLGELLKAKLNEQNTMNYTKLNTQNNALNSVRARHYIVGSIDANGYFSVAGAPVVHTNSALARAEAHRLAKLMPTKAFVIMQLIGAELVPQPATVSI